MPHSLGAGTGGSAGPPAASHHDPAVRQLEAALRGVLETVEDAVFVCDPAGRITLANAAAGSLFADRPVATFDDLLARVELDRATADLRRPVEVRLRDRPSCWLELRVADLGTPRPQPGLPRGRRRATGRIVVARDVTADRRERLVREAFLGMLSHELRTPITTVYAGSRMLAGSDRLPAGVRRELAADVASEAERLYELVEDLLALARIERGQLDLGREPVLLQRIVAAVLRTERGHRPEIEIQGTVKPGLPAVAGDQRYLEQVVRNLVGNAARYSQTSGRVDVLVDGGDDEVRVHVVGGDEDAAGTSPGKAPFDLAERSPEAPANAAGVGIGLFVCHRLVAAMSGRIWSTWTADGRPEIGFALPRYREAEDRRFD